MPITEPVSHHDLVVCACGNQEYTARDAIHTAIFRGELDVEWKEFLHRLKAERRGDELNLDLDESAISSAAEAFRYEHDLITAEETEMWLTNRGLNLDDFTDYFARDYYARTLDEEIVPDEIEYNSASPELRQLFMAELILSGQLDEMTKELMWRLAAFSAEGAPSSDAIAAQERHFLDRNGIESSALADWLRALGRESKWFNEMLAIEAAYQRRCDSLLLPHARRRELAALRLSLTRFETELIELESRDAAQEALFCVREDGMSMEEVAAEGRYPYRRADFLLEDLPTDAQSRFQSVSAGEVLEPMPRGDGFELCRVMKKVEPQPDDPRVKSRIDQRLLERHFSELTSKYVQRRLGGASVPGE
jgi:hypothetical protein